MARLDVTGAVLGVVNDPGFVIQAIDTPVSFDYPSLGLRYQSNGDLILMQGPEGIVEVMHSPHDGAAPDVLDELVDGLSFANALYIDPDDIVKSVLSSAISSTSPSGAPSTIATR